MSKVINLREVINEDRRFAVKDLHRRLFDFAKSQCDMHGDDMCGFALISWNKFGEPITSLSADFGAVAPPLVPAFVHDALHTHLIRVEQYEDESKSSS